ncbi:MAG TPA: hypothetical protein VGR35_08415 [Tepidisphaeraceae bacterium]|nr:hypothetical protein [Tepidisphaeraceae bacterium]
MPRRLANGLTLLSAVVCVGSAMWVGRSFVRIDYATIPIDKRSFARAVQADGYVFVARFRGTGDWDYHSGHTRVWIREQFRHKLRGEKGIPWVMVWGGSSGQKYLILPLWLLPLLTAIGPVWWWRKRRREAGRGFAVEGAAPAG